MRAKRKNRMILSKGFSIPAGSSATIKNKSQSLPILLVVDDEQEIATTLADQFRRDYHVMLAGSADEALAILRQHDVSIIISDQRMPEKTGSELLAEACLIKPDAVRILLTGYADLDAVVQAVNEGKIFFYLTKPWNNKEIGTVVTKALEHNLLLRDNHRLVEELRRNNAELEARVKERTMQLEQRALELEAANEEISRLVYLDPLTGVANRRSLDATLAREIERVSRLGSPLTVILLDVDHFKSVNDTFGHAMGDKVLQAIAATVAGLLRPYDLVARYGGEEFLVMMPGVDQKNGEIAAERFRLAINAITIDGISQKITASFGVATLLVGQPAHTFFQKADRAMYRAKQNGRNRVETADEND